MQRNKILLVQLLRTGIDISIVGKYDRIPYACNKLLDDSDIRNFQLSITVQIYTFPDEIKMYYERD